MSRRGYYRNNYKHPFIPLQMKITRVLESIGKKEQITFQEMKKKIEAVWCKPVNTYSLQYRITQMAHQGLLRNTQRGIYAHKDFRFDYETEDGREIPLAEVWQKQEPIDAKAEIRAMRRAQLSPRERAELEELLS